MQRHHHLFLTAFIATAICIVSAAEPAFSQTKDERATVKMMLLPYDSFPTAADFKKVAKDPRAQLLNIYKAPDSNELIRLQALDALSLFPNAEVRALYREILSADWKSSASRATHRAINGLMHGFGQSAIEEVSPLLTHRDIQVRLTVVHALAKSGGETGRQILLDHLEDEKDRVVRETITKQTTVLR
jgi:HEAT repeat protein